ncbi:MAG: hypothetical protein UZ07_CHB004000848 [Chlorobi bacterium OLB7]|nr:MAG: hypothetical protein UZ07_CHB004000848 [Chlorobi bacterium OLB7]
MNLSQSLLLLLGLLVFSGMATAQDVFTVAKSGDVAAMAKLLKKKPKLAQATQPDGETALHLARPRQRYRNGRAAAAEPRSH